MGKYQKYADQLGEVEQNLETFMEEFITRDARTQVIFKRSMSQMKQTMDDWSDVMRLYSQYGHHPPKEILSEKVMKFHLSLNDYVQTIKNLGLLVFEYKEETRKLFDISLTIFDIYSNITQEMGMEILKRGEWL